MSVRAHVPLEVSLLNAQRWYWASLNPRMTAPFESGQAPGVAAQHGRRTLKRTGSRHVRTFAFSR